jgi:hypothetical protein
MKASSIDEFNGKGRAKATGRLLSGTIAWGVRR